MAMPRWPQEVCFVPNISTNILSSEEEKIGKFRVKLLKSIKKSSRVILNGFGIYTAWTVIASLINLTTALVYPADLDMTVQCFQNNYD